MAIMRYMVFWSKTFSARGTRSIGSLLLDQTGWPPVKQRATELWTAKVGISWRGVAEYLSDRGITPRRTDSAGVATALSGWLPNHPSLGGRLIGLLT